MVRFKPHHVTTSIVRGWVKNYEELSEIREEFTQKNNGRFPCCGRLSEEESKKVFEVIKESSSLREKLKAEQRDKIILWFDGENHELDL